MRIKDKLFRFAQFQNIRCPSIMTHRRWAKQNKQTKSHFLFSKWFFFFRFKVYVDTTHLCVLEKRPDLSTGGTLKWSLPYDELCLCDRIIANAGRSCESRQAKGNFTNTTNTSQFWFLDNPGPLTRRETWNKTNLDLLFEEIRLLW